MAYPTIDFLFLSEEDMIAAGVKDIVHAFVIQPGQKRVPVIVKGLVVIMGMGVKIHGRSLLIRAHSTLSAVPLQQKETVKKLVTQKGSLV